MNHRGLQIRRKIQERRQAGRGSLFTMVEVCFIKTSRIVIMETAAWGSGSTSSLGMLWNSSFPSAQSYEW